MILCAERFDKDFPAGPMPPCCDTPSACRGPQRSYYPVRRRFVRHLRSSAWGQPTLFDNQRAPRLRAVRVRSIDTDAEELFVTAHPAWNPVK